MSTRDHPDWWRPMGGQNSQDSILERRSLVWNDNGVEAPDAPPANYTATVLKGKFYTRGCRGMIEQVAIYCIRTAAGTLTLRLSPHPVLGPFYEVTITPGAAWAWVGVDIEEMWNYDSLFIWVYTCAADVSWGYDAVQPYDGHWSTDAGATWEDMAIRPFIRAVYTGETPGDVPVSGIINNIPIPYSSSIVIEEAKAILEDVETLIAEVEGAGYCDLIRFYGFAAAHSDHTHMLVYCDDVQVFYMNFIGANNFGFTTSTPRISLTTYAVDGVCNLLVSKRWEFRRRFEIRAVNFNGNATVDVYAYPCMMR